MKPLGDGRPRVRKTSLSAHGQAEALIQSNAMNAQLLKNVIRSQPEDPKSPGVLQIPTRLILPLMDVKKAAHPTAAMRVDSLPAVKQEALLLEDAETLVQMPVKKAALPQAAVEIAADLNAALITNHHAEADNQHQINSSEKHSPPERSSVQVAFFISQ
jgi:hypothetical protein